MVYAGVGSNALDAELIDAQIKAFAEVYFTLKPRVTNTSFTSDTYSYYRESNNILSAASNYAPGSSFPVATPIWEKNSAYMKQHNLAIEIKHHDVVTNRIDIFARAQEKIAQAVVKSVEDAIADAVNGITVTTAAQLTGWNATTRADRRPEEDLGTAVDIISRNYKKPSAIVCHPTTGKFLLLSNSFKGDAAALGSVPNLSQKKGNFAVAGYIANPGLEVITTTRIPSGRAVVLDLKKAVTWNSVEAFQTAREEVQGEYVRLKAWELGMAVLTDPQAGCVITGCN